MTYVTAPIHDLLIRIKNAYMARRTVVTKTVYSAHKERVLTLLQEHGFIAGFDVLDEENNKKFFSITLHEVHTSADIPVVKFFSRPSRPWYIGVKDIKSVA